MKSFLIKSLIYSAIPVFVFLAWHFASYHLNKIDDNDAIYVWGDSQAYRGIDLGVLSKKTDKLVYSAAQHGSGVYSFMVFVKDVPDSSLVVVALSKPAMLRRKFRDNNRSRVSLNALFSLKRHNYSWSELKDIVIDNKKPKALFVREKELYEYADSIVKSEPVSLFSNIYGSVPIYYSDKKDILIEGLKDLESKGCKVVFLEFPYHPLLKDIENNSVVKFETDVLIADVLELFHVCISDTLQLDREVEMMHDYTHLNELGASFVSDKLSKMVDRENRYMHLVINWRE